MDIIQILQLKSLTRVPFSGFFVISQLDITQIPQSKLLTSVF